MQLRRVVSCAAAGDLSVQPASLSAAVFRPGTCTAQGNGGWVASIVVFVFAILGIPDGKHRIPDCLGNGQDRIPENKPRELGCS